MRNLIIGVAAAMLAIAAPGLASADSRATVGVHYVHLDSDAFVDNVDIWGLDGAYNYDFSNGWTLQADGSHDRADAGGFNEGASYGSIALGMRTDAHAIYGWAGLTDFAGESGIHAGIGGQLYLADIVIDGSVGYTNFDDADVDGTNVNVGATWYFNDNFGVSGKASHTEFDTGGPNDDWTTLGVGAEYRFDAAPVSVALNYRRSDIDPDEADAWTIGLTMDLGSGSLRERHTQGPSWSGAREFYRDVFVAL